MPRIRIPKTAAPIPVRSDGRYN